jgi:hypothetical protein
VPQIIFLFYFFRNKNNALCLQGVFIKVKTMPDSKKLAKQRLELWKKNPHCENCGVLTILPDDLPYSIGKTGNKNIKIFPNNTATIQHKYDRLHPQRNIKTNERRHFLWCIKCNREYWFTYERERAEAHIEKLRQQENKL